MPNSLEIKKRSYDAITCLLVGVPGKKPDSI